MINATDYQRLVLKPIIYIQIHYAIWSIESRKGNWDRMGKAIVYIFAYWKHSKALSDHKEAVVTYKLNPHLHNGT